MDDNLLRIFIAVTTFAIVVQAGILIGLYLAVRKSTARMEALAVEVTSKTLPTIEAFQITLTELRPKIEVISSNAAESSNLIRNQLARIDATLTDALDRTRLQVIRADELLNRTMDRVEETSEIVHKTVVSPLRQVNEHTRRTSPPEVKARPKIYGTDSAPTSRQPPSSAPSTIMHSIHGASGAGIKNPGLCRSTRTCLRAGSLRFLAMVPSGRSLGRNS